MLTAAPSSLAQGYSLLSGTERRTEQRRKKKPRPAGPMVIKSWDRHSALKSGWSQTSRTLLLLARTQIRI